MKKSIITILFCFISYVFNGQVLPKTKYEKIDSKNIAYYELGNGSETIVLLHGWPQTAYVWRKVIPILSEKYRVLAIDLPGLGNSDLVNDYSTQNIAAIINKFRIQKKLDKIHLVGHDLGTWVALTYAIDYQSSLSTLTLVDAGIPGLMDLNVFQPKNADKIWQFYFHGIADLPEILVKNKEEKYFDWYFKTKAHVKNAIGQADKKIYTKAYKKRGKMNAGFEYYRAFEVNALYNRSNIKALTIPVLAVGGFYALGENVGNAVAPYAKKIKSISLGSSGHYVPEEQPESFSEIVLNFIKTEA